MDKKDVIHMLCGIYSVRRKGYVFPFVTLCMDPEHITLSEMSQNEKNKFYMISLMGGILNSQTHRIRA